MAAHPGAPQLKAARAPQTAPTPGPSAAQVDFAAMVDRYGPAVVNISTAVPADGGDQIDQQVAAPGLDSLDPDDPVFALVRAGTAQPQGQPPGRRPSRTPHEWYGARARASSSAPTAWS